MALVSKKQLLTHSGKGSLSIQLECQPKGMAHLLTFQFGWQFYVSLCSNSIRYLLLTWYLVKARNGRNAFALGSLQKVPKVEGELMADDIVLITFTVNWYNWGLRALGTWPNSPAKKKPEGYGKSLSFNVQDIVLLYSPPHW